MVDSNVSRPVDGKVSWQRRLEDVTRDNVAGAHGVVSGAGALILEYVEGQARTVSAEAVVADLALVTEELLRAQPAMASLVSFLNRLWRSVGEGQGGARGVLERLENQTKGFMALQERNVERVAANAAVLVADGARVLTISASSTVKEALLSARRSGHEAHVTCLESRPVFEGRKLATELADAGLPVALTVDSAMHGEVSRADIILIGVDSLAAQGVVGKLGSAALTSLASQADVPAYALGDRTKLWPDTLGPPRFREWPAAEVWPDIPEGIVVRNRYFDVAAWSDVRGVVTELGVEDHLALRADAKEYEVHPRVTSTYERVSTGLA